MTEAVLLAGGGSSAVALAPRLSASGYSTVDLDGLGSPWLGWAGGRRAGGGRSCGGSTPADCGSCATRFAGLPLLLDLVVDSVDARADLLHTGCG